MLGFVHAPLGIFGFIFVGLGVVTSMGALIAMARERELRERLGTHVVFFGLLSGLAVVGGGGCMGLTLLGLGALFLR